jgi:hypothetical protein
MASTILQGCTSTYGAINVVFEEAFSQIGIWADIIFIQYWYISIPVIAFLMLFILPRLPICFDKSV